MELVHTCNSRPLAPPHLRLETEVRNCTNKFNTAVESKAHALIQHELIRLNDILDSGNFTSFTQEKGRFCRDLRYLGGHAPRALQKALLDVATLRIERQSEDQCTEIAREEFA